MSDLIKTLKSSSTGDDVYPNIKEDNIPTGAVTSAKIGTSAVITGKINDGAVTTNKVNDGAITYEKLALALKNLIDGKASSSDLIIVQNALSSHTSNTSNPHSVTKSQVGLGNVDNTSDANKPVSTATQTALNGKQDTLTFDNAPTQDSANPVKSGGVYTALSGKASLSGDNTFTGENNFTGELKINNEYVATENYVDNALSDKADDSDLPFYNDGDGWYIQKNDGDELHIDSENFYLDKYPNVSDNTAIWDAFNGKQNKLYLHSLSISIQGGQFTSDLTFYINVLLNNNTPINSLALLVANLPIGKYPTSPYYDETGIGGNMWVASLIRWTNSNDASDLELNYLDLDNNTPSMIDLSDGRISDVVVADTITAL